MAPGPSPGPAAEADPRALLSQLAASRGLCPAALLTCPSPLLDCEDATWRTTLALAVCPVAGRVLGPGQASFVPGARMARLGSEHSGPEL